MLSGRITATSTWSLIMIQQQSMSDLQSYPTKSASASQVHIIVPAMLRLALNLCRIALHCTSHDQQLCANFVDENVCTGKQMALTKALPQLSQP